MPAIPASELFQLRGAIALVTGGGTGNYPPTPVSLRQVADLCPPSCVGRYWTDVGSSIGFTGCQGIHHW